MATQKKGILSRSPEWWKHLRWAKRKFWKRERQAATAEAIAEARITRNDIDLRSDSLSKSRER